MTDKLREGQGSTSKSLHGHMKDWEMKGKTQEIWREGKNERDRLMEHINDKKKQDNLDN